MGEGGAMPAPKVLICDRDRKWSGDIRRRLGESGVRVVFTPTRAPKCERLRGTFCSVDQRGMSEPADSDWGPALPPRRGPKRGAIAVAHSILVIAYYILRDRREYKDLGPDYFDRVNVTKLRHYHLRRLAELGCDISSLAQPA